ncbi:MAG TPA: SgcJ/EcaC family oxidoreductase [Candidatus Udaeobacter sp.]|nr:SgcJ/EcaC family oxidoreductase [Candidatus Udaeobacter sp.]
MNQALKVIVLTAFALSLPRIVRCDSSEAEATAIRELEKRQQDAWNRHDAKAYASLFSEDGDCVNVVGWWWKGRAEIEKKLTAAYAFVFRESVLTISDVDIKFPAPEMAIAHVRWTMVGARTPEALPKPQQGIQTQLLQKQKGKWLIVAFQNTNAIPEIPFPQGPLTSPAQPSPTP